MAAPGDRLLHRPRANPGAGGDLLARPQPGVSRAFVHVNFAFDHGDARSIFLRVHEEHGANDRDRHIFRLHVQVTVRLLRGADDDPACPQPDSDTIFRTFESQFGFGPHLDARLVREHEHRAGAAVRAEGFSFSDNRTAADNGHAAAGDAVGRTVYALDRRAEQIRRFQLPHEDRGDESNGSRGSNGGDASAPPA